MTGQQTVDKNKVFNLELTAEELAVVMEGLHELPAKKSLGIILKVDTTVRMQLQPITPVVETTKGEINEEPV